MIVEVEHHCLDLFAGGRPGRRGQLQRRAHLFQQPEPDLSQQRFQPQFVPKGGLVQREAVPQQPEGFGLCGVLGREGQQFQSGCLQKRKDVFLLDGAARDARNEGRLEQVEPEDRFLCGLDQRGVMEHIAVDHAAHPGLKHLLLTGGIVSECAALDVEQLNTLVPVPRGTEEG